MLGRQQRFARPWSPTPTSATSRASCKAARAGRGAQSQVEILLLLQSRLPWRRPRAGSFCLWPGGCLSQAIEGQLCLTEVRQAGSTPRSVGTGRAPGWSLSLLSLLLWTEDEERESGGGRESQPLGRARNCFHHGTTVKWKRSCFSR